MITTRVFIWTLFASLAAVSAGGQTPASCTVSGKNLYVRDRMKDIYFWSSEVPNVDPVQFDSPEAYLEAVRFRPIDSSYSYITDRASNTAFFSDSQFIGFGFSPAIAGD